MTKSQRGTTTRSCCGQVSPAPQQPGQLSLACRRISNVVRIATQTTFHLPTGSSEDFGGPDFLATWRRELENAGLTIVEAKLGVDLEKVRYVVCFNPPDGLLAQCPNLRLIHSMGAGITHRMLRDEVCPTHVPMVRVVDPLMAQRMATFCMWAVINVQRKWSGWGGGV